MDNELNHNQRKRKIINYNHCKTFWRARFNKPSSISSKVEVLKRSWVLHRARPQTKQGYGQLITTVVGGVAVVNEYSDYETFMENHNEIDEVPMNNPYIEVRELIQTKSIIHISHHNVKSIILPSGRTILLMFFFM